MKKSSTKDFVVIGFALFAMFFGAGNMIFPPYIGRAVGDQSIKALLGFLLTGVGLPLSGIIACAKINGTFADISGRVGKIFSIIVTSALIIAIGPMLAVPRTAATTFELTIHPLFPSVSPVIVSIVYFIIALSFILRPSGIVDSIGKILTPGLLIMLSIIIVKGLIDPIGTIETTNFQGAFSKSILEGYQTMDAMTSVMFATIIIAAVRAKGYTNKKDIISLTTKAGVIAAVGLAFVYGGLMVLGSQTSGMALGNIGRSELVIEIVKRDLGHMGTIILGIAVALACLTTAIGIISTGAKYFSGICKDKISYNKFAILISVISAALATGGVEKIVGLAEPILQVLYPIIIVLILLTLMGSLVKNDKIVKVTVYVTLAISILDTVNTISGQSISVIKSIMAAIPLSDVGFCWIVPSMITFLLTSVFYTYKEKNSQNITEENAM
ncbi:branched-chain amino acid transport system II carrier protein [Clostridium oceanicum]|uniref:Branched-chain amino acid transport system carrier protein n=1 Tax=Clostridium oceanicum TaxID=1543 RepID=A0ABP3UN84_9CLOT